MKKYLKIIILIFVSNMLFSIANAGSDGSLEIENKSDSGEISENGDDFIAAGEETGARLSFLREQHAKQYGRHQRRQYTLLIGHHSYSRIAQDGPPPSPTI